jgi:hypothetical protein
VSTARGCELEEMQCAVVGQGTRFMSMSGVMLTVGCLQVASCGANSESRELARPFVLASILNLMLPKDFEFKASRPQDLQTSDQV